MKDEKIINNILLRYSDENFIIFDGFDDAVLGFCEKNMVLIYSYSKCIEILSEKMSHSDAVDYFLYNVCNLYLGDKIPIICYDDF